MDPERQGRVLTIATYAALFIAGALLGVIGAFLVPLRLGSGVEGLSAALALVGNLALGIFGGRGLAATPGALAPGAGWFVAVGTFALVSPGGDVVIPGRLGGDPGVATTGTAFLLLGVVGTAVAIALTARYTRRRGAPTPPA